MIYDVIIIGAGASGLMATKELSAKGYSCCVLEAAPIPGGRIHTINEGFSRPTELGAEFVHGDLPLTLHLLKEACIDYVPVEGTFIAIRNGKQIQQQHFQQQFIEKVDELKQDMTLQHFLETYFNDEKFSAFRKSIQQFAGGFDLADPADASVFSLKNEWDKDVEEQYRLPGGYCSLIDYLADTCTASSASIRYNAVVTSIEYTRNNATVHTKDGNTWSSRKAIITVSAGVLKQGDIQLHPAPENYLQSIRELGFGTVIKFLLEFKASFWKAIYPEAGFFITDEPVPTWWTQWPAQRNLLTGWLGGPAARARADDAEDDLLQSAISSLSSAFDIDKKELSENLLQHKIINWQHNPYIRGGYNYASIATENARQVLSAPIDNTIFFAGEAMWTGQPQGTVEAALQSGKETAERISKLAK